MGNEPSCIFHTCQDVVALEPVIASQDGVDIISSGEHREDVLHCEASTTHDGLATEDAGIDRDSIEEIGHER